MNCDGFCPARTEHAHDLAVVVEEDDSAVVRVGHGDPPVEKDAGPLGIAVVGIWHVPLAEQRARFAVDEDASAAVEHVVFVVWPASDAAGSGESRALRRNGPVMNFAHLEQRLVAFVAGCREEAHAERDNQSQGDTLAGAQPRAGRPMKESPFGCRPRVGEGHFAKRTGEPRLFDDERSVRRGADDDLLGTKAAIGVGRGAEPLAQVGGRKPVGRAEQGGLFAGAGRVVEVAHRAAGDHSSVAEADCMIGLGECDLWRVRGDNQ